MFWEHLDWVRFPAARPFDKLKVFDREQEKGPEFIEGLIAMPYTLYILRGSKNHLYIGISSNLEKRVRRHLNGDGAEFTRRNKTDQLVYTEHYTTLLEARKRETQIKKWRREKKENLIKFGKPIR